MGPKHDWWWVRLILGVLMFVLGAWAIGSPEREVLLFVNLIGFYLLLYGSSEIFILFALRTVGKELGRAESAHTDAAPVA